MPPRSCRVTIQGFDNVEHTVQVTASSLYEGSIAKGKELVTTGGGKTTPCTICHGDDLKGLGNVPYLAGRSPSQLARQIIDIQNGNRNGTDAALMKPVVKNLNNKDIVNITAYLASLTP